MKDASKTVASLFLAAFRAAALGGLAAFAISLSTPKLEAGDSDSPVPGSVPDNPDQVSTTLNITYQVPGFQILGTGSNLKLNREGDQTKRPSTRSKTKDGMGTEVTTEISYGTQVATLTIKEVPGPDRLHPYEVAIQFPYLKNISGTKEGTGYEITWSPTTPGGDPKSVPELASPLPNPNNASWPVATVDSVLLSDSVGMFIPHDSRLAFDIESGGESGSIPFIRLRAKSPTGTNGATLRINLRRDPDGALETPDDAESEVRAICAPYLPNSVEKTCQVQALKQTGGTAYYCVLTNGLPAGPSDKPEPRYLLLGVFRIGNNAAYVIGNLSEKDDTNFRMMLEALGKLSLFPVTH